MSGRSGPTPFCHSVQGTKISVYFLEASFLATGSMCSAAQSNAPPQPAKDAQRRADWCGFLAWLSTGSPVILKKFYCRSRATIQNHISS